VVRPERKSKEQQMRLKHWKAKTGRKPLRSDQSEVKKPAQISEFKDFFEPFSEEMDPYDGYNYYYDHSDPNSYGDNRDPDYSNDRYSDYDDNEDSNFQSEDYSYDRYYDYDDHKYPD
jgi:hypothetical protein